MVPTTMQSPYIITLTHYTDVSSHARLDIPGCRRWISRAQLTNPNPACWLAAVFTFCPSTLSTRSLFTSHLAPWYNVSQANHLVLAEIKMHVLAPIRCMTRLLLLVLFSTLSTLFSSSFALFSFRSAPSTRAQFRRNDGYPAWLTYRLRSFCIDCMYLLSYMHSFDRVHFRRMTREQASKQQSNS